MTNAGGLQHYLAQFRRRLKVSIAARGIGALALVPRVTRAKMMPHLRAVGIVERDQVGAAWEISRHGLPTLRQAIAGGQYDFPQGLFFFFHEPIELVHILDRYLPQWLDNVPSVFHLDFHTGLGPWATYKLLLDSVVTESRLEWLRTHFRTSGIEDLDENTTTHDIAYHPRGSLGKWCQAKMAQCDYLFLGAEFGTYGAVKVAAGLRAENQAHHWGQSQTESTKRAKQHLQELFCPASPTWQQRTLGQGIDLVMKAVRALTGESNS